MTRTAIVVGAGIGGLTTAIALEQKGWTVTVLEQAKALTEVGAGIQISPNGTKILNRLGVLSKVEQHAFEAPAIQLRLGMSGHRIFHMPMGQAARDRWGGPHLNMHRADLVQALCEALHTSPALGKTVRSVHPDGTVNLDDSSRHSADVVVAADGIHSTVRRQLAGDDAPRFTGNIAWRCMVPATDVPAVPLETTIWAGAGRHAITNRIRGGTLVNFVGLVETRNAGAEVWDASTSNTHALADFANWASPVTDILKVAPVVMRWPVYDRAPLDCWTCDRIALLGDAAHAIVPSMAQGAVQAIEDAWVLASCLETPDIPAALKTYEQLRRPRTTRVQKTSMTNLRQFHKSGFLNRLATYGPMAVASRLVPDVLYSRPDWIYRATPEDLCQL